MEPADTAELTTGEERVQKYAHVRSTVIEYLSARSEVFKALEDVKAKGWANEAGDTHFKKQRLGADQSAGTKMEKVFFEMMERNGIEMEESTGALKLPGKEPQIMDLCLAPGGFTATAIKFNPDALVFGITLPEDLGGHPVLLKHRHRTSIIFSDITMEAAELGVSDLPKAHTDFNLFKTERLLAADRKFDLTFCDGQVLRNHAQFRNPDREPHEASRLTSAQLIIAMQHMKPGGTLIMLLHKSEAWDTIKLLQVFDKCSHIQLFKPTKSHVSRNSFYLIAQEIKPNDETARVARDGWLQDWKDATYHRERRALPTYEELTDLLETFGPRLIELAEPTWKLQKEGIEKAAWFKKSGDGKKDAGDSDAPSKEGSTEREASVTGSRGKE